MQSETSSSGKRGKHRIVADLNRLEQDSKFLEDESEELERTDDVSTVCEELLSSVEFRPDPLLPSTNGPANPLWDRWFEGPRDSQGCSLHCTQPTVCSDVYSS